MQGRNYYKRNLYARLGTKKEK